MKTRLAAPPRGSFDYLLAPPPPPSGGGGPQRVRIEIEIIDRRPPPKPRRSRAGQLVFWATAAALAMALARCAPAHAQADETGLLTPAEKIAVGQYLHTPGCIVGAPYAYPGHDEVTIIVTVDGNSVVRRLGIDPADRRGLTAYGSAAIATIESCPYLPLPHDGRWRTYKIRFSQ
jgi:hypothetical protein